MGMRQSVRLGEYFAHKGVCFEAVITGTLRRHTQTYTGMCEGTGIGLPVLPWPGLNEYDSATVIAAIHPHSRSTSPTHPRCTATISGSCATG